VDEETTQLVAFVEKCQIALIFKGFSVMIILLFSVDNLSYKQHYPQSVDNVVDIYLFCEYYFST